MTKETIIKSALKYLVKRQIEEGSVGFAVDNDHDHDCCWDDVLAWIEAQSCENAVSREAVIRLVEQYPNIIGNRCNGLIADIKHLPPVTPRMNLAETSQDCISRQAVFDIITFEDKWLFDANGHNTNTHIAFSGLESRVKALPSVTPQRPKGKWIKIEYDVCTFIYKCSKCGMRVVNPYKYCPNCGNYNGGVEDEVSD